VNLESVLKHYFIKRYYRIFMDKVSPRPVAQMMLAIETECSWLD
jgi:hypothetical protein